ncbi:hypothetical protein Snov_4361 [Ancylobacter novellus DSM 506]|uniref:Uncharacterized protein n=1 Tax=Ancylobacter novellus (strain ATCC 8093 / DSM 506 / JCM 20403 / CCM 1077 / IAM 12100 / NBRC 12443 / NCIMB 10456) TaxID=639283 RepID=D7A2U0_ANCN5|nr:hypothetical protein [Ancylobacter novellus]ADH91620.1 hypothetical protein Snov_4361 [Ancylobacter novellus DSM 506]
MATERADAKPAKKVRKITVRGKAFSGSDKDPMAIALSLRSDEMAKRIARLEAAERKVRGGK